MRGNVDTRLRKVDEGEFDAIVLARAGLVRLGLAARATEVLSPKLSLPAVGQGALGIECRADDDATRALLAAMHDPTTATCVAAERGVLIALEGDCKTPIAAYAERIDVRLHLRAFVSEPDGSRRLEAVDRAPPGRSRRTRRTGSGSRWDARSRRVDRKFSAGWKGCGQPKRGYPRASVRKVVPAFAPLLARFVCVIACALAVLCGSERAAFAKGSSGIGEPLRLEVGDQPEAYYYKPRVRGLRPVLMYLHGRGGNPAEDCRKWAKVGTQFGWVVCPQGPEDRGDGTRAWNNSVPAGKAIMRRGPPLLAARQIQSGRSSSGERPHRLQRGGVQAIRN